MSVKIEQPYPVFRGKIGLPLDGGLIYIGTAGLNPETSPIQCYFDEDFTLAAPQPLRTINGYISRNGSPANIFLKVAECSITIKDRFRITQYTDLHFQLSNFGALKASQILDESGLSQQEVNKGVNTIADLLAIQSPSDGTRIYVKGYHSATNFALLNPYEGGGLFIYNSNKSSINDGGVVINGWVRQYNGDVDISWFGAKQGENASPFIESALKVQKTITIMGSYTLESIVGIPDQNNYSKEVIRIKGANQATLTINCPAGAVFTSAAAKLNPSSVTNLYTGKIDVSGINFIGTIVENSVIFNGDRLYNMNIHHNNFYGDLTIIKAYLKRESGRQYTQSTSINNNHLANVYRVIESDKAYNFDFSYNMCETCKGGIYIGADSPWDPSAISLRIQNNLWEGGGLLLKTNGGIIGGSISSNYCENNTFHDAATEKCLISINRSGTGSGYTSGLVFESNLFSGNTSISDYVDVRYSNQSTESSLNSKSETTASPVFIGNWSNSYMLTNFAGAVLENNRCANRNLMLNAYSSQKGRVSYISGYANKLLSSTLASNKINFMNIDTSPCFAQSYIATNFKVTLDVNIYFKTASPVNTASCSFKLDVFIYTPYGAGTPSKANLKCVMYNFMQSDTSDLITGSETMRSVITTPTISLTNNGDGTYKLELGTFANASSPNWGVITQYRMEYTMQSTLIASETNSYSTANLLAIS